MTEDWAAVADAVTARMAELGLTQVQLAAQAGMSQQTVREIQKNLVTNRQRRPQTLSKISEALKWPANYLHVVLGGEVHSHETSGGTTPVSDDELSAMREQLHQLNDRLDAIDRTEAAIAEVQSLLERMAARLDQIENVDQKLD